MNRKEALVRGLLEHPKPSELEEVHIPEVDRLIQVPQDPKHHPEGDVLIHSMEVIDRAAILVNDRLILKEMTETEGLSLMCAAWLHDIGKWKKTFYRGETKRDLTHWTKTRPKNTRIVSYGHEAAGAELAPHILKENLPNQWQSIIPQVTQLIALHMRPTLLRASKLKAFRKIEKTGVDMHLLGLLNWADKNRYPEDWYARVKELEIEKKNWTSK